MGKIAAVMPLQSFVRESLEILRESFGKAPLTKAVMDLMMGMVGDLHSLVDVIEETRERREDEVGYVGGNAATLAVKVDKSALERRNFSSAVIRGADLSNASLRNVNFAGANLADCVFTKVLGSVWSVVFSPDGKFLAIGDGNGVVSLWDTSSRREIMTCKGHTKRVRSVAFSPDGQTLVSGSSDRTVRLWNIRSGQCIHTLQGHTDSVWSVAFSPDGQTLVSGSSDRTVRLWNINTGECLHTLQGHTNWVRSVTFSPDSQILANGSDDGKIKLWDVKTGECLKTLINDKPYELMNITGVKGLTESEKTTLKALGAVEDEE